MPRQRTNPPLHVWLNGRLVGVLQRAPGGAIDFRYHPDWLAWAHAFPVSLSLPLREGRFAGGAVVAVFDNLLPDDAAIRERIAARTGAGGTDAFHLLGAIGHDCVGALQFLPEGEPPGPVGGLESRLLRATDVAELLRNLGRAPLGLGEDDDFRISIAGAQEKTALLFNRRRFRLPLGATATTHILKPQIGKLRSGLDLSQSVENEHFCLCFLRALGMSVAATEVQDFEGVRALVVERFDRRWDGGRLLRLPQEDLCQAMGVPPARKYQGEGGPSMRDIVALLGGSDDPTGDRRTLVQAQLAYWLLGATDGHAKNFSIYLYPGGRFRLTPLYDVMSSQPYVDAGQIRRGKMKLALSVGGKYRVHDIHLGHFEEEARQCGLPAPLVPELVEGLVANVPVALDQTLSNLSAGFPASLVETIAAGVRSRLARLATPRRR
jgi:serine/threonine-protein kinase HipA